MNLPFILAVALIPLLMGSVIFLLVFRSVHKKYLSMFQKIILAAGANPDGIRQLIAGTEEEQNAIIRIMSNLKQIIKISIIKSNREQSYLQIAATEKKTNQERLYDVNLEKDGQWRITRFSLCM